MAEVGGQERQSSFGILTGPVPLHEGVCRESVAHCRADEGPDCRMCLADRSAETTRRRFDVYLPHPNDCPSWRRTNRKSPLVLPNVADVWRCSLQAPCRSMHAKAPDESCRTWCRGSSAPLPSDRHLEVPGYVLHPGVDPKRSEVRIDNSKPTVATYRVQSDRAS